MMSASERMQEREMQERAASIRALIREDVEAVEHASYPPRHHDKGEICLRAITTGDCGLSHDYNGEPARAVFKRVS
jgi:hypothetical protein